MEMLNGFDESVTKRIKTLKPDDVNADVAMYLLERSAKSRIRLLLVKTRMWRSL